MVDPGLSPRQADSMLQYVSPANLTVLLVMNYHLLVNLHLSRPCILISYHTTFHGWECEGQSSSSHGATALSLCPMHVAYLAIRQNIL